VLTALNVKLSADFRSWLQRHSGGWSALLSGAFLLAGLILFFTWELTFARIEHEKQLEIQNAIADNSHISAVLKANLEQVLGKMSIYADLSSALISGDQAMAMHVNPTLNGEHAYLRLAVLDRSGRLLHSSARRQSEPVLEDFAATATDGFRKVPAANSLLTGHPQSVQDAWRVPVLAGVWHGNQAQGLVAAVIDLGYFLQLFQEVELGQNGRIEIISDDGYQLAELVGGTLSAGQDYHGSGYLNFLKTENRGTGVIKRDGDGWDSVMAYSHLEKYPLIVVVSQGSNDVLTEFNVRRKTYIRWASLVSLAVFICVIGLVQLVRRQYAIHKALANSERNNRKLIDQLKDEKKRAYQLASHDHLTGLPNRMLFAELAVSHITRARRSRFYHAVLFIDLDRFKIINDTLGHRVGDLLLKEVARRFRTCLRESDVVARFGGDEFVMLINDVESIADVGKIAEKLVTIVSEPFVDLDGHNAELSPSIGIALCLQDGETIDELLKHADAAMYTAKAAGRGTYRFHDPALNNLALRQMELLQGLRRAVRENEFVLYYQPRVATEDFSLTGLEALVRWQHPELGLIFPNDFILLAEENDLIAALGLWVINAACAQLADWQQKDIPLVPVAVNISAKQFRSDTLVDDIFAAMERHGVPAHLFEIEITESCLVDAPERAGAMLNALVDRGVKVSMDDYGTGFASIGYLKTLPLHAIKIDRSFIREIHNDSSDAMIVSSTITLAHNLDLVVVAEGVETRDQLVHLKTIGCDQVQGYYFHRPLPVAAIEPVLQEGRFDR